MSNIIKLHRDPHQETRLLLPWYLTGKLPAEEREMVAAHLAGCAACRGELEDERRLARSVAELPINVELGWAKLQARLDARAPGLPARLGASLQRAAPWMGWAAAAALAAVTFIAAAPAWRQKPAVYHALAAAPVAASGDAIAVFKPDATEAEIREALIAGDARIVDGPSGADAYVLATPPAGRNHALTVLRARPAVLMAEPIEPASQR
jgi:anti-sigma factor RsiW